MDRRKITRVLAVLAASAVLLFGFLVAQRLADHYKDSDVVQTSQEDSFCVGDLTLELTTRGGLSITVRMEVYLPQRTAHFRAVLWCLNRVIRFSL